MAEEKKYEKLSDSKAGRGAALEAEAEAALSCSWCSCFPSSKVENAIILYRDAAGKYKQEKNWKAAGNAFVKAARLSLRNGDKNGAASDFAKAGSAFKRDSARDAVGSYEAAGDLCLECSNFSQAAKHFTEVATLEEKDNPQVAIRAFGRAIECYERINSTGTAATLKVRCADVHAQLGEYKAAVELYEATAKVNAESSIGRWSVKDQLFRSFLCYFLLVSPSKSVSGGDNADTIAAKLESYFDILPSFPETKEAKILQSLVSSYKEGDAEKFDSHIKQAQIHAKALPLEKELLKRVADTMAPDLT